MPDPQQTAALAARAQGWAARCNADPYDLAAREGLADVLFEIERDRYPPGTVQRGRILLLVMSETFPTKPLRSAYLANLDLLLAARPVRPEPGKVVLGVGSGRSGSTTLTALLATVEGSCSTHENPPPIHWSPLDAQVELHLERLAALSRSFSLVFEAAHWWLNALDAFFARFPAGKVIGLVRETAPCVESFLAIKGRRRGSINHWVAPGSGLWPPNSWDPLYPTYPLPPGAAEDPEGAKRELVGRYVVEYNRSLTEWAARRPEQVLLLRTEELSSARTQQKVFAFLGASGTPFDRVLNAGTVEDGRRKYWY